MTVATCVKFQNDLLTEMEVTDEGMQRHTYLYVKI